MQPAVFYVLESVMLCFTTEHYPQTTLHYTAVENCKWIKQIKCVSIFQEASHQQFIKPNYHQYLPKKIPAGANSHSQFAICCLS